MKQQGPRLTLSVLPNMLYHQPTPAAMDSLTPPTEEMFLLVFCLIDDLYNQLVPDTVRYRPGYDRIAFSDSEVITLSIMQEAHANDAEVSFYRLVSKDYRHLFPKLIERSRYHRRRKALLGVQLHLLRHLMTMLKTLAAWFVVDSAPIETVCFVRSQSGKASIPEAAYGYIPSKKRHFFGFRLHLLTTDQGAVVDFVLSAADVGERAVAEHLLASKAGATVLADNGYSGFWLRNLLGLHGGRLWFSARPSTVCASKAASRLRRFHRGKRALVETVFSMLADQFTLETTRARSLLGLKTRLAAKLLSYNVSYLINEMLGRPALAMKSLHM